ncbi:hypothetical protein O9G_006315 [Rozella allomycis CSF55]|uniref:Uncharacterized protein n=1 Tax=Rozella allomycis (strain CSF55) TaxID=988480 RepID=A0A075B1A4_ROZAC|nr:hypothetical protein O9G_006315 [Rozella allomycis CSF55]|eukprot:EPZ36128.1 hypothetical protein O9G_006315 [Rozella allomycis CSF55]
MEATTDLHEVQTQLINQQKLQLQQAVPMQSPLESFLNKFRGEIKTDVAVFDKLSNNAFHVVVDRDVCLTGIANEILRRWLLKESHLERRFVDRHIGLQAPPGGGKS